MPEQTPRHIALPPVALSIAGSDSSGGAGIQADLRTFNAFGVYGASAISAITAQNTRKVFSIEGVSPSHLYAQIKAVLDDLPVKAAKTGMLYSKEAVQAVCRLWNELETSIPLVVDPVFRSSSGQSLSRSSVGQKDFIKALCALFGYAALVTPNLPEIESILDTPSIQTQDDMQKACLDFYKEFQVPILLKGGHLTGAQVLDVFFDGDTLAVFSHPRIQSRHCHGTGCTLSAAITACLAGGKKMQDSIKIARGYLQKALLCAPGIGKGSGPLGQPSGFA